MSGGDEPLNGRAGRTEGIDDLRHRLQIGQKTDIRNLLFYDLIDQQRISRRRRFKSDSREHELRLRMFSGQRNRIVRRIDHMHFRAPSLRTAERLFASRNPDQIPERHDLRSFRTGEIDQPVHVRGRGDADRAPRPGDQVNPPGNDRFDSGFRDSRRVASADLHDIHFRPVVFFQILFDSIDIHTVFILCPGSLPPGGPPAFARKAAFAGSSRHARPVRFKKAGIRRLE